MSSLHSYPSIYNLGHRAVEHLFNEPVVVQEKVDGSQFSFGSLGGELVCRSKGQDIVLDAPEKMFVKAVETAKRLFDEGKLVPGATYRGEFLQDSHHNTLKYDRIPVAHVILFDVDMGDESYVTPQQLKGIAEFLGLESVPLLFGGFVKNRSQLDTLLETPSILGGTKIEGVVIKNYERFGPDKKILMGKLVRPEFKELNRSEFRAKNPAQSDIIASIVNTYKTEPRWKKAVQHLREAGELDNSPKDIGAIMKEIPQDILKECKEEIADALWRWAWPKIERGVRVGAAEWYKEQLIQQQFEDR